MKGLISLFVAVLVTIHFQSGTGTRTYEIDMDRKMVASMIIEPIKAYKPFISFYDEGKQIFIKTDKIIDIIVD